MPEESTTPDLVASVRRQLEAGNRRDPNAAVSFYAPDAVFDLSSVGLGNFEGRAEIRGFFEDWMGSYDEYRIEAEEIHDLGHGVAYGVYGLTGRPVGSSGEVRFRYAAVGVWVEGLIVRNTNYSDIDEARAAAERLAKERG